MARISRTKFGSRYPTEIDNDSGVVYGLYGCKTILHFSSVHLDAWRRALGMTILDAPSECVYSLSNLIFEGAQ